MPTEVQPEYDSQDAVPEPLRPSYEADANGKWRFTKPMTIETLPEVAGLKRTLDKYKGDYATASGQVTEFQTKLTTLEAELQTLKADGGSTADKKKVQEQIDALKNGHKAELEKAQGQVKGLTEEMESMMIGNATDNALMGSGTDSPVALRPHIAAALRVVRGADGRARIEVMDVDSAESPKPTKYNTTTGQPMTPAEYAISLKEKKEFKALFPGSGMSGGDGKGSKEKTGSMLGKRQVTREELKNAEFYRELQEVAKQRKVHVTEVYEIVG